ncbi:glycosyltransferase [Halorubrum sp. Ea1]|uniref:glycosyltransferase n=1 Tax=Halorubrum sp. Ea1 TaxID=1480718 RepID=UPI000B99527E|nr:glycosyltransferase [Halorubrum sp. Ea1]OYR52060.1 glycosyltransferase [Halorubrum sp. Ea1]
MNSESATTNSVSCIVPVYNDSVGVSNTLQSLSQQTLIGYEVLAVDNGSTDDTRGVIHRYAKRNDTIHLLVEDRIQGSYAARNKGIKHAQTDILAFLDADETVDEDWLETAVEAMNEQGVDYLGCKVELTASEETLIGRYNAHTGFPVKQYLEQEQYAPTCALLVRREVFDNIGPFDARLISGGDREFGERVHEAGYKQGYSADATVHHPARVTFRSLAKKNVRVGRGFCQKQRYYPHRYGHPGIPPSPNGQSHANEENESQSVGMRLVFAFLSFVMLTFRGIGYYYEFLFGEDREDTPAATN